MFDFMETTSFGADAQNTAPRLDIRTSGLIAGTKVATNSGWAPIETIRAGHRVLTFDRGLQTVVAVTHHQLKGDVDTIDSWPLNVPAGALGNRADMTLLPNQPVMIESDAAEIMTGDPFAIVPGASLVGYRGIEQMRTDDWVTVIQLHFAQDEVVYANIGALFLCRAQADLMSDAPQSSYDVLPIDLADDLIDCMMDEETLPTVSQPYSPHAA